MISYNYFKELILEEKWKNEFKNFDLATKLLDNSFSFCRLFQRLSTFGSFSLENSV